MKAVQWIAPREVVIQDTPKPEPGPREALIRIESVGVCGSDIHYYVEGAIGAQQVEPPFTLGHEFAGIVEAVGPEADASLVGKRVAVEPGKPCEVCEWCLRGQYNVCPNMIFPGNPPHHGALSEFYTVPARFCFPVPDSMPADEAAMMEPLAVALHTAELCHLQAGMSVAILGLGPIGLLTAQVLRFSGAGRIIGADLLDYRVHISKDHGVDEAFNANALDTVETVREWTKGRGVDVVIDATNASSALPNALHIAKPAGRVVHVGISGKEMDSIPVGPARRKELTLQWVRRFKHNYPAAIDLVARGKLDIRKVMTHSFSFEQSKDAFELVTEYADGVLKASIDY